jgi:hypothetical protein
MVRYRRILILTLTLSAVPLAVDCEKTGAEVQEKASQAQKTANVEITNAEIEANRKAEKAQAQADKTIAAVQADFAATVEDYRHSVQSDLALLHKRIDDLDATARVATGKKKLELQSTVPSLRSQCNAFEADLRSLDQVSADAWDGTKARLDREWTELQGAVDRAF